MNTPPPPPPTPAGPTWAGIPLPFPPGGSRVVVYGGGAATTGRTWFGRGPDATGTNPRESGGVEYWAEWRGVEVPSPFPGGCHGVRVYDP